MEATSFATGPHPALTFVLSGLSKISGLPQMKAAWVAVFGPQTEREQALARLDVIDDTFLSMNAPIQCALPQWLVHRRTLQHQIQSRTRKNLSVADQLLATQKLVTRLEVEAGWYIVLRIPAIRRDEEVAVDLIHSAGVSVHPGYFFGFPQDGWLVLSLLAPEEEFLSGVAAILNMVRE
jgi:aspartate/methionine/tyrosine aminotransferase